MLVLQSPVRPNGIVNALASLASAATTRFRALVAYTTLSGCETLFAALETAAAPGWEAIPKSVITSFDYGITEPQALEFLTEAGVELRIANLGEGGELVVYPSGTAFHPKLYLFGSEGRVGGLVGSPNLTRRALTINVEAAYRIDAFADAALVEEHWETALAASEPLTDELLAEYQERRPAALRSPRPTREPRPPSPPTSPGTLRLWAEAVVDGDVNPQEFQAFWVEAGTLSGGSGSQLELPRRANAFFGYAFARYDNAQRTIGYPALLVREQWFNDGPLAWHGNNRMERLNLPTPHRSGLTYSGMTILFRRVENGFSIEARLSDSPEAQAWRAESEAVGHVYRVGERSPRTCGLI